MLLAIITHSIAVQVDQSIKIPSNGAWGIFHYYIGAKYIKELGYFNLYSCAYDVNKDAWQPIKSARDLRSYKIIPIKNLPKCPLENFTTERFREFVHDTRFIAGRAPVNYWSNAITDKGFNAPPFWAAFGGIIAGIIPLNNTTYIFLFNLDLLFVGIAAGFIWYGAGRRVGLITLALAFLYFGTLNIIASNFMQYAWFPLLAGAFVFWNKKKYRLSGVLLGFSAGLQVFPGFFALPVFFVFIISVIRNQKKVLKTSSAFIFAFLVILIFCVFVGSFYAGGVSIWDQWNKKITIQRNYINGEIFNIGFPNLAATIFTNDYSNSDTYSQEYIHTINRNKAVEKYITPITIVIIILTLAISYVLYRSKKIQPLAYGYFLMYILTTLSPYYYLTLALLPFVFWKNSIPVKRFSSMGTVILFGLHLVIFRNGGYVVFNYSTHLISKLSIFIFFVSLLCLLFFETRKK